MIRFNYLYAFNKMCIIITQDIASMPIIQRASGTCLAAYYEAGVGQ